MFAVGRRVHTVNIRGQDSQRDTSATCPFSFCSQWEGKWIPPFPLALPFGPMCKPQRGKREPSARVRGVHRFVTSDDRENRHVSDFLDPPHT